MDLRLLFFRVECTQYELTHNSFIAGLYIVVNSTAVFLDDDLDHALQMTYIAFGCVQFVYL